MSSVWKFLGLAQLSWELSFFSIQDIFEPEQSYTKINISAHIKGEPCAMNRPVSLELYSPMNRESRLLSLVLYGNTRLNNPGTSRSLSVCVSLHSFIIRQKKKNLRSFTEQQRSCWVVIVYRSIGIYLSDSRDFLIMGITRNWSEKGFAVKPFKYQMAPFTRLRNRPYTEWQVYSKNIWLTWIFSIPWCHINFKSYIFVDTETNIRFVMFPIASWVRSSKTFSMASKHKLLRGNRIRTCQNLIRFRIVSASNERLKISLYEGSRLRKSIVHKIVKLLAKKTSLDECIVPTANTVASITIHCPLMTYIRCLQNIMYSWCEYTRTVYSM